MADSIQVAVFAGGSLKVSGSGDNTREAVLALPLGRLLARVIRISPDETASAEEVAKPLLQALSPYPDEDITVGIETMREDASGTVAIAAALPESAADDIGEALDEAKLSITRIDALALGTLRENWALIAGENKPGDAPRRLVAMTEDADIAMFVLDGDSPCALRTVPQGAAIVRETTLLLLDAEDFAGSKPLSEVVIVGDAEIPGLETFAQVRRVASSGPLAPDAQPEIKYPTDGIAERSLEEGALNALPESWREMLEETRFKAKLKKGCAIALAIWGTIMAVIFAVPLTYGFMTDHQRSLSREHAKRYNEVKEMREKVRLVQKYSDHSRGALEILKAVSDRLPAEIELTSWNFRREEEDAINVRFSGESDDAASVYKFKDALQSMAIGEGEDAEKVFADVKLTGPSAAKGGRQKFDIDCTTAVEEEL